MKSQQFANYTGPVTENQYATPEPKDHDVIVKVSACGVCHSDIHVWDGYFDLGGGHKVDMKGSHQLPFTLGHEIAGEVIATGKAVTHVEVGQRYIVYPWIGCGSCPLCETDQEHLCNKPQSLGVSKDGGFSTHVVVPHEKYLFPLQDLPAELACTYACSGVTAYSAVNKIKQQVDGRDLLIVGAGGVGLSGLAMAKALHNCRIIVADIDEEKRKLAREHGADEVIDPSDKEACKNLLKSTKGGVAAAIDFVGSDRSAGFALQMLNKGSTLIVVGLFGGAMPLPIPMLPLKALTISGSFVGSLQDMKELMALVHQSKIDPITVTTRPLEAAHQTLCDLRDGKVMGRVVLTP